jgi:hypothetical protein
MKMKDGLPIGISLAALVLSAVTSVHDWLAASHAATKRVQSDVYNAYQLGQSAAVVYAYEKANQAAPPVNGQTQAQIASVQASLWVFKAQGYAEYFKLSTERFQTFLNQVKNSKEQGVSEAFEELNSTIQVASDHKAVAAYDLGWQTTILGIESAANPNSQIADEYATVRTHLDGDLAEVGVKYSFPAAISNRAEFVAAIKAAKTKLDQLQP